MMYRKFSFKRMTVNARYYFTLVGECNANLIDRLTHKPIAYLGNYDSVRVWTDKLNKMTQEEYYNYIFSLGIKPQENKDGEEWFKGAWIYETDKLLEVLKLDIVETTVNIIDLELMYKQYLEDSKRKGWRENGKAKFLEEATVTKDSEVEETVENRKEYKETKQKKLLRKNLRKVAPEAPKEDSKGNTKETAIEAPEVILKHEMDKLTRLKASSKITFGEYVKMKRELITKYGA